MAGAIDARRELAVRELERRHAKDRTGADELMIDCRIHDPLARQRSHAYAAQALAELG